MPSIKLDNVCVSFPIYDGRHRSFGSAVMTATTGGHIGANARNRIEIEALTNVSFQLGEGDRVALMGHNGAGKTTLLRVLAGIYQPVRGAISVEGRIAPLFDVSLGMSPDATGYENIRIRGLYLGMTDREINRKMDEIAAFTELGDFLNMPLRTYSAGMHTRLAFAISTSIDPEILLLDEGIGAGDAAFLEKANDRLETFVRRAGIMVLASHSAELVKRFCNKALVMEHGHALFMGPTDAAQQYYEHLIAGLVTPPPRGAPAK